MAASAWQLYNYAKRYIGNGTITLGAGVFKMVLAVTWFMRSAGYTNTTLVAPPERVCCVKVTI